MLFPSEPPGWYELVLKLPDLEIEDGWHYYTNDADEIGRERVGWGRYKTILNEDDLIIQIWTNEQSPTMFVYRRVP